MPKHFDKRPIKGFMGIQRQNILKIVMGKSLQMKFTSFILKRTFVQGYVIFSILNFQTFQEDFDRCKTLIRMFNAVPDHL